MLSGISLISVYLQITARISKMAIITTCGFGSGECETLIEEGATFIAHIGFQCKRIALQKGFIKIWHYMSYLPACLIVVQVHESPAGGLAFTPLPHIHKGL